MRRFEIGSLVAKAERAFAAGDFAGAVRQCQDVLKREPGQPVALQLLGLMAQRTGANEVAIGFFQRALANDRRLVPAHLGLGDAHMAGRQWDAGIAAYNRAVALAPRNAEAHSNLATAFLAKGQTDRALESFRRAAALDPEHKLAAYMAAELAGGAGPRQAEYVRGVFDDYAPMFERHVVETLHYRMPQIIAEILAAQHPEKFGAALDLGCGTGLMADALAGRVANIDGVDLSPRMVEIARQKGRYRELAEGDLHEFLARPATKAAGYDLVVAADVFIYVGRLEEAFALVGEVLAPGGLFVFSVEHAETERYVLQPSSRHAHGECYIADLARTTGFERLPSQLAPLRQENKLDIMGRVEVLRRGGTD